jgi:hypothetical protein
MARKTAPVMLFSLALRQARYMISGMGKEKNPHAQALGHLGGTARANSLPQSQISEIASQGGKARAESLSAARRREIAKKAVAARERKRAQQQRKGKS